MPVNGPAQRALSLILLNHDHIMDFVDTGPGREGEPTTARAQIQNLLLERITLEDGREVPVAFLAPGFEPAVLHPKDPMDAHFLRSDEGGWRYPPEAWMAERAKRVTVNNEASANFAASVAQKDGAELLKMLGQLSRRAGK